MSEIKIFLSSKVKPEFEGLDKEYTLGDLRQFLKKELESELLFDLKLFKVIMNEEGFRQDFTEDAFDTCLKKVEESDVVVILYNGDAGWAPKGDNTSNGICHEEYLAAVNNHPSMTFGINLTTYFTKVKHDKNQSQLNQRFSEDVNEMYRFKEFSEAGNIHDLQQYILRLIIGYVQESFVRAFTSKKQIDSSNTVFGKTLDWSKLNYGQRTDELIGIGEEAFADVLKNVITNWHAIPDNMSVADARNRVGRPFLKEHDLLNKSKKKMGVVHFIAVYGNATESQVKALIGFPDITAIKAPFGFYLWEQNSQIQMFFLKKCINPNTVRTRKSQVVNWLKSSKEESKVLKRAKGRYHLLKAMNKSIQIANG